MILHFISISLIVLLFVLCLRKFSLPKIMKISFYIIILKLQFCLLYLYAICSWSRFLCMVWDGVQFNSFFFLLFLAMLWSMQDPSSLTRDRSPASCSVSLVSQPLDHYGSSNLIPFWYGYLVVPAKSIWESIFLPLLHMPSLLQIKHLDLCRSVSIMSSLFHGIVCVWVCVRSVAQVYLTLCHPMDCSP